MSSRWCIRELVGLSTWSSCFVVVEKFCMVFLLHFTWYCFIFFVPWDYQYRIVWAESHTIGACNHSIRFGKGGKHSQNSSLENALMNAKWMLTKYSSYLLIEYAVTCTQCSIPFWDVPHDLFLPTIHVCPKGSQRVLRGEMELVYFLLALDVVQWYMCIHCIIILHGCLVLREGGSPPINMAAGHLHVYISGGSKLTLSVPCQVNLTQVFTHWVLVVSSLDSHAVANQLFVCLFRCFFGFIGHFWHAVCQFLV